MDSGLRRNDDSLRFNATMYGAKDYMVTVFEDPMLIPEDVAFDTLREWKAYMLEISNSIEGRAKAGAMSIWYLSILACHIAEIRIKGRELWAQLERGFVHCHEFNPNFDCVKGLEPFK